VIEGVINALVNINGAEQTIELLKRYIFKIVPMVSIDGVIYGNSRCDITGSDTNRKWTKNSNPNLYPIISAIKKMVSNLAYEGY
jgi:murein tripeptide amidase MpaA